MRPKGDYRHILLIRCAERWRERAGILVDVRGVLHIGAGAIAKIPLLTGYAVSLAVQALGSELNRERSRAAVWRSGEMNDGSGVGPRFREEEIPALLRLQNGRAEGGGALVQTGCITMTEGVDRTSREAARSIGRIDAPECSRRAVLGDNCIRIQNPCCVDIGLPIQGDIDINADTARASATRPSLLRRPLDAPRSIILG